MLFERANEALDFLRHHRLEPSVPHYALALAHVAGTDGTLSRAIVGLTGDGFRLHADDAARLIAAHLSSRPDIAPSPAPSMAPSLAGPIPMPPAIVGHAERLGALAVEAGDITRTVGADVGDLVRKAEQALPDGNATVARLAAAENELTMLRAQVETLKLAITADLRRARDPAHDPLTSALSPAGARHVLDQVEKHDRRYVLLMLSIDGLVEINREFGTSVGDNVLNGFAGKIQKAFPDQEVIRWAGNEFIVVVPDRTITAVRSQAEDVLALLQTRKFKLAETGEWIGTVTASGAIVMDQGDEFNVLLARTRAKLDAAIQAGGDRIVT